MSPQEISALGGHSWDNNPTSRGYAVRLEDVGKETERYIDDGNWNALQRVLQYAEQKKRGEVTDDTALAEAQAMLDIAMDNYDGDIGLVRWKKQPDPRGNDVFTTISTATSAELALLLNQFTADPEQYEKNLRFALVAYEGARRTMQDPETKIYYDGLSADGLVADKRLYSYNTGIMISGGMWLYQATGDKQYLEQAEEAAAGALKFWDQDNIKTQDAALAAIYFDRLFNLGMVTKNEQLRDQINRAIIDYGKWYGSAPNLDATKGPNSPWWYAAGDAKEGVKNEAFAHFPSAFAATQVHITSLAALAQDRQDKHTDSVIDAPKRHIIPSHVLAQAQTSTKPPRGE